MNKLAILVLSVFVVIEIILGDTVICGMPLWLVALILFTFSWIAIICIKDKVRIEDSY